ncbi:DNA translocase FtsK [Candidatus Falkowbacteria bacterium]|uniref:Cell division protein FtsK n=1 Tax=Candidatus Buchananbacteria bacterium CG10_big_fil_rev_8_21_14_0_10_33_19 TaxID=1974525 RepID=A0A2H0W6P3_9BACT|nr:DNA translocase FtsK [Candidatus Falkowbacteria bacterium]PIS06310.1 MAG: cell division protein FtsK [Candidatus Buchananbacteria bacterium CG10_big_fil_rev_8_21_14_0_10_33_19]
MAYRRRKKSVFKLLGKKQPKRHNDFDDRSIEGGFGMDWSISNETKKGIIIIFLFVMAALSFLGLFNLSGNFGKIIVKLISWLLGSLKWFFPVLAIAFGYFMLRADTYKIKVVNYIGTIFLVLGLAGLWHLQFDIENSTFAASNGLGGGYVGVILSLPLLSFMGFWGALIVCFAVFLVGLLLTFETSLYGLMWPVKLFKFVYSKISEMINNGQEVGDDYEEEEEINEDIEDELPEEELEESNEEDDDSEVAPQFEKKDVSITDEDDDTDKIVPKKFGKKIELPIELLVAKSGKPTSGDIKANQLIIKKTLSNFGIEVEMSDVNIGPTVTQYTFRPADGVKLSRITNLNSDLALTLAAHPIRIEAPIPGKSLVGIEIPNQTAAKVTMNEILAGSQFKNRESNLMMVLGKDVSGKPYFAQLDKMPHLLIAGSTGSGKSVCVNSIITSLLYQNSPDELKFILVDPKRVELPLYNGIPYLLTPVITDVKKTINALKWTTTEMERRFEVLSKAGKRNIAAYNKNATDKLPYIVFVIDELADLMSTSANDVEAGIVRLAQMARAVGIHLILATQRPSVEVITGLIKANIPGRIAFSVASLIDSRTILDTSGAEKLVGRGDMLYIGQDVSKPKRIQGVYISDRETHNIINYIKQQGTADYIEEIVERQSGGSSSGGGFYDDSGDALMGDAKDVIRESGKASASLLQRRLKIGYARAARILDLMEDQGIVGPADGAKPREVFLEKLGGVDTLKFASREHNLTGELRPTSDHQVEEIEEYDDENDEEFDDDEIEEEIIETLAVETTDNINDNTLDQVGDDSSDKTDNDEDFVDLDDSEKNEEESEAEEDNDNEAEDEMGNEDDSLKENHNHKKKKTFSEDEWT